MASRRSPPTTERPLDAPLLTFAAAAFLLTMGTEVSSPVAPHPEARDT
jgi:hypothetical protein